jgi:transglutaminase-like putative cysteine protease
MVYRYSWIAGVAAIGLAFWELSFLMRDSLSGTPWQVAILVATLLGAGITWTAIAYRAHAAVVVGVNVIAFILTVGLLVAPDTLWLVFPTVETWDVVWFEISRALEIIQYGVEPVRPVPGLVMLLASLFWTLGFLLVAGLLNSRPFVAILTPLIVALQFVIIDRRPKSISHLAIFVGIVAFGLLAIRIDERDSGAGRLRRVHATTKPTKRPSVAVAALVAATLVASLLTVGAIGKRVPTDGFVSWRSPAGFSDGYSGSVAYNPYTDIRAGLISRSKNPVFRAKIEGAEPAQIRFRTVTLDVYNNGRWGTDRVQIYPLDEEPWVDPALEYRGETVQVATSIRIDNLSQPWLPAPDTPIDAAGFLRDDTNTMRVRRLDGALMLPGDLTYEGMEYQVLSEVPRYDGPTIAALALAEDGTLSPLFEIAEEGGETLPDFRPVPEPMELPDEDFWLEFPEEELGTQFVRLSESKVKGLETNFEKALALENYFRDSGEFTYDDDVPSEYTTGDVTEWLADEDNPFVRHGYCEQFSTAMALMARAVGVPSRVVLGFTPGDPINDDTVQVYDKNAHSWVELWIPSYGWMAFDPTPRANYSAPTANETLQASLGFSLAAYVDEIPEATLVDQGTDDDIGPDSGRFGDREGVTSQIVPGAGGSDTDGSGFSLPAWALAAIVLIVLVLMTIVAAPLMQWWRRRRFSRRLAHGDIGAAWEDIVDRLVDLREPVDPAHTPLEAAREIDPAFVPLAQTYGRSLYGSDGSATALVTRATEDHEQAQLHLTTRYSRGERIAAIYRPSGLVRRWRSLRSRLSLRK